MRIERVAPSQHIKGRVLVFLEGGECLKITEQELLDFDLRAGGELDGPELERLKASAGLSGTRAAAAGLIGRRAMSRRDLEKKLREKGASADDARYAAEWLESIGALDDAQYAAALVRHYSGRGYGRRRIQEKLYEKGVPRELWEDALDEMPENDGQIDDFLTGKLRGRAPDEKEKRRLTNALMRRGFPWSDIKAAWERLGDRIEED